MAMTFAGVPCTPRGSDTLLGVLARCSAPRVATLGVDARGATQTPVRSASAENDRYRREGASLRNFHTLRRQLAGSSAMRLFATAVTSGDRAPADERRAAQSSQALPWTPFGLAIDNERTRA